MTATTYAGTDDTLDLAAIVEPERVTGATIQERWEAWSAANPRVLNACERLIGEWFAAGHQSVGIGAIWERIRWEYGTTTGDVFRANNSYRSRAARDLLQRRPEWEGRLRTRELRAA